jgi:hypothetical protein
LLITLFNCITSEVPIEASTGNTFFSFKLDIGIPINQLIVLTEVALIEATKLHEFRL